jgi:two-component system, NtrC family, response regulator AlgB
LFYRLNVISMELPGLAQRKSDIPRLVENYVSFYAGKLGRGEAFLEEAAMNAFLNYNWPGNLRELKNAIERSLILCTNNRVTLSDLPAELRSLSESRNGSFIQPGAIVSLQELESEHIKRVLDHAESMEKAADILGIDTATLYRKRKKLGLI